MDLKKQQSRLFAMVSTKVLAVVPDAMPMHMQCHFELQSLKILSPPDSANDRSIERSRSAIDLWCTKISSQRAENPSPVSFASQSLPAILIKTCSKRTLVSVLS